MQYVTVYKKKVNGIRFDKTMRTFLMTTCMNPDVKLQFTTDSMRILKSRAGELSPEALKLIVGTNKEELFSLTMHVMPTELLLQAAENENLLKKMNALPKEKLEPLLPRLHEVIREIVKDNWQCSDLIRQMLEFPYTWEHGRTVKAIARHLIKDERCTPVLLLEMVRRFSTLHDAAVQHPKYEAFLLEKKLKLVEGEKICE
jgi:hypothetical protein